MLYNDEVKDFLSKIPNNARICIWGAGTVAKSIKEDLLTYRPDTCIVSYVDTFISGSLDGIKIYSPDELYKIKNSFDIMIISIRNDCTVIDALLYYNDINNFIRISSKLAKQYRFTPSKLKQICSFLENDEDKKLFLELIKARITNDTTYLKEYVRTKHQMPNDRKRTIKQYTSFINYNAIEFMIEGGMFNGLNTLIFKKLFKNLKKIYAFELLYEKVKNKILEGTIATLEELEIIPLALWNKKDKLEFTENVSAPYSSGICPQFNRNTSEKTYTVDATTIDDYVNQNNISKIDFIKMDIEGAEYNALTGAEQTLIKHRPQLAISIYHSDLDMVQIPLYLNKILDNYIFKIGQYSPDNDETIFYAIPNELYNLKG